MMRNQHLISRDYLRTVKHSLTCPLRLRGPFLHRLQKSLNSFWEENPDATIQDLYTALGTPSEAASQLMEEHSPDVAIRWQTGRFQRTKLAVCCLGLALLVVLSVTVYSQLEMRYNSTNVRIYVTETLKPPPAQ